MDNGASSYRRFLDGDQSAFDDLLELYQKSLILFLNRYVHNLAVAEELAADAFLMLIVHPRRYHFRTPLKSYLFMIGRNKALNYLKHEGKLGMVPLTEIGELPASEMRPDEHLVLDEERRTLYRALNALPQDYRTVLHLVYFDEMSYEEAGQVMKKNLKQVNNLVYRAKKALRSVYGKEDAI